MIYVVLTGMAFSLFSPNLTYAQNSIDVSGANGGAIRLGWSSSTCNSAIEGAIRYNSSVVGIEYCNGVTWTGATGGTTFTGVSKLDAGEIHDCLIKTDGTLWCWGTDGRGELGLGSPDSIEEAPVQVGTETDWVDVTTGEDNTCGIRDTASNRTLWCWGSENDGVLGNGVDNGNGEQQSPIQIGAAVNWNNVSCGGSWGFSGFCCATQTDNTLWCWGNDEDGQTAQGAAGTDVLSPTQVGTDTNWDKVSVGHDHACAIRTNGTIWCWGENGDGPIGNNSTADADVPTQENTSATDWQSVVAGGDTTCAIKTNNQLWCWGQGTDGSHGLGNTSDTLVPTQVGTDTDWSKVTHSSQRGKFGEWPSDVYAYHGCAIKTNNDLYCWGSNDLGQIGDGSTTDRYSPVLIGSGWEEVSAGAFKTCGVKSTNLYCWGYIPITIKLTP